MRYRSNEDTVPMSALTATYDNFLFALPINKAVGPASAIVTKNLLDIREKKQVLLTFSLSQNLRSEATDIQERCSSSGWDGYDARPITKSDLVVAIRFAELLPDDIVQPEIIPEPSGKLGFLWSIGQGKSFSVTPEVDGNLVYAGILGKKEVSGQLPFNNEIPQEIILNLFEFYR